MQRAWISIHVTSPALQLFFSDTWRCAWTLCTSRRSQASLYLLRKKYFSYFNALFCLDIPYFYLYKNSTMQVMPPKLPASDVTLFQRSCVCAPHDAKGLLQCRCCTEGKRCSALVRTSPLLNPLPRPKLARNTLQPGQQWFVGVFRAVQVLRCGRLVLRLLFVVVLVFVFVYIQFGVVWWRCLLATSIICQPFFQQFTHLFRGLPPNELFATRLQLRLCDVVVVVAGQWNAISAQSGPACLHMLSYVIVTYPWTGIYTHTYS